MALWVTIFSEAIIFALYIFVCLTLMKPRFPLGVRLLVYGGVLLCSCGAVIALALSSSVMTAFTLLPLIAYLPFSVCVYILSDGGIFETAAACSVGALASLSVKLFRKILLWIFADLFRGTAADVTVAFIVAVLAAGAAVIVFRHIRRSFRACVGSDKDNRILVVIPAAAVFLMVFVNFNRTTSVAVLVTTLIIALSFFAMASRLFVYSARIAEADENEKKLSDILDSQRQNFERICQSVDASRHYRHDMRHHLKVLSGLARQNNSVEILEYIEELNENTESCTPEILCKNPAVNAVLSEYIKRTEIIGCRLEHKIYIPEELPFELPDVCIVISNALENAMNACEKCPEDKRYIDLLADFSDDRKLKISVRNSCANHVEIDTEGLPVVEARTDGHGIGLRGVKKTVEKYNGFICCAYENDEFIFCAELFRNPNGGSKDNTDPKSNYKRSKALPAVLTSLVCAVGLLNFSPTTASALSEALSIDIKTISYGWGDNGLSIIYPEFSGDDSDKLNQAARDFIDETRDIFRQYILQKYEGYTALDAGYRVYINDQTYLSSRFFATLNVGGSMDFSRCVVLDKQSGEVLSLSDLFDEDRDYIAEISAEVLRQMEQRNRFKESKPYFIPGGIWKDDECFKEISPDQEFYLNPEGQLVIVFEEYTVASGSEGSPEFVMPNEIFRYTAY